MKGGWLMLSIDIVNGGFFTRLYHLDGWGLIIDRGHFNRIFVSTLSDVVFADYFE
jgi:hypothetical protein